MRVPVVKVVLTIAGSDSSAGAGVQADLKAIAACGAYGACAITALTAQNTVGVQAAQLVDPALVRAQIGSVFADLPVHAVKTGMLGGAPVVAAVVEALRAHRPAHVVVDPVVRATSGDALIDDAGLALLRRELLPMATVVTPNAHEVAALAGRELRDAADAYEAARALVGQGTRAVLVTGGDLREGGARDLLVTAEGERAFEGERIETRSTHGTGCSYASAIAALLARGLTLVDAIGAAKAYVTEAIRAGPALGSGHGPTDHFFMLRGAGAGFDAAASVAKDVPRLHVITDETVQGRFSHLELARLAAEGGADAVQLREKRGWSARALFEVACSAREALAGSGARLVVDDRIDVALAARVDAVHLGADDVTGEDARRVMGPGALIGGTANSLEEARVVAAGPVDYLGVGPVFGTATKAKPAPTLGIAGLREICEAVDKPVIAIGNITAERVGEVLEAGAHGVAVVSAVVAARDPAAATARIRAELAGGNGEWR